MQKHINVCPEYRGIRVALAYEELEGSYLGFFCGYCGGGLQCDNYFFTDKDFYEIIFFDENSAFWLDILTKTNKDICYKAQDFALENAEYNELHCFYDFDEKFLEQNFEKIIQNGVVHYYFETEEFDNKLLSKISREWSLLTIYP